MINEAIITYCGQTVRVNCDRNCSKSWGTSQRPTVPLSDDEDDYETLADHELGESPVNPGTYEFTDAKPLSPDEFPNRWCVRECERCNMSAPGEWQNTLQVLTFKDRQKNILE